MKIELDNNQIMQAIENYVNEFYGDLITQTGDVVREDNVFCYCYKSNDTYRRKITKGFWIKIELQELNG